MPDISMCLNKECPSARRCVRFMAKPNPHRQSYGSFSPQEGEEFCDMYWDTKGSAVKLGKEWYDRRLHRI